jgi:uncharacterized protein YdeI (YjbR/CyaY-like superfamily)
MKSSSAPGDPPLLLFPEQKDWAAWLARHHDTSAGVWLQIANKASGVPSVSYSEAVEVALCYGWIDAREKIDGRKRALALVKMGRMKPAGLEEIDRSRNDGRLGGCL